MSGKLEQRMKMKKTRTLRKRIALLLGIIVTIAVIVVVYQTISKMDFIAPTYAKVSVSSSTAGYVYGCQCTFKVLWMDNVNVSGYIFGANNTGVFMNDTWVSFPSFLNSTSAYATATRIIGNGTGDVIQWRIWCNDTSNNWRSTSTQELFESNKIQLVTSMGDITIELYDDMPITTNNFKDLARRGIYDGTIFHRIIKDFMVQGGDPTGTGYGDPSIPSILDEFSNNTDHNRNDIGTIAMANAGANTGSSQFFINLKYNAGLDNVHPVFGKVIVGMDIVEAMGNVATDSNDKPTQNVTLIAVRFVK